MTESDHPTAPDAGHGAPKAPPLADTQPRLIYSPDAPWMTVAAKYVGTMEAPRGADNPQIVKWLQAVGPFHHDETPWCSAFANACMVEAGLSGSGKANARSWLHWGQPLAGPRLGAVCVFSRPPLPASGHVAFYVGDGPDGALRVLGGNQNNRVCIATYPHSRLLGYRWPT